MTRLPTLYIVVAIVITLIIGATMFFIAGGGNECDLYAYAPMNEVPSKCIGYYLRIK